MKKILSFSLAVCCMLSSYAQTRPVTGRIVGSDKGDALNGVSIRVKGSDVGTTTDANGRFSLNVPSGNNIVLIVSNVGFKEQEVTIGNKGELSITLSSDAKALDDVVVVGYGTQKKRAVTGSVVSVGYDQFKDRSFANVAQSLEGAIAGVNITTSQGAPGFGPTIKIRGNSSITAGTTPLYVVDGMALENFDLNQINPQDIQSVEVLKDAASSAIYGSRGANGVILVTTKLGKSGKPQVAVTLERGFSKVNRKVEMMDAQQWIQYYIDARNNAWVLLDPVNNKATDDNAKRALVSGAKNYMIPPDFLTNPAQFGKGTDWQDVVFRKATTNNAQVSLSGGTDKTSYLFSAGYLDQEAVVIENFYKRLSLRTNIRQKISERVTAGLNVAFTGSHDRTDGTSGKSDVISLAIQSDPIFPEYNEKGTLGFLDPTSSWSRFQTYGVQLWHPYSLISYADKLNKTYNTLANGYVEVKPIKDLTLKGSLSGNLTNNNYNWYWEQNQGYGYSSVLPAQATSRSLSSRNWQSEFTANYNKTFGDHTLGAIAGYSAQKQRYDSLTVNAGDFPNDLVRTINAAGTITKPSAGNGAGEWSLLSVLGRVSYGFKNRYFLNATLRRDGSSRFGPASKWGTFPSVSGAWLVSDEEFMKNLGAVTNLKLRVSYGQTGNNLIPNYGSVSLLGTSRYVNGTTPVNGLRTISIANPNLKWEKTDQYNIGFDLALLNNRLNITADAYKSVTKDMLLNVPVPAYTGFTTQLTNIGSMENKGVELGINSKNINGPAFRWSTDFNISLNRNKVLKLGPNNAPIEIDEWGYFVTEVGQPLSNYKGYIFDGIYNNQQEVNNSVHYAGAAPGDPIIRDYNGDKKIDAGDRAILGNAQPDFTAGLTNTFSYKGFEFSFMLQGVYGNEIWNQQTRFSKFWNDSRNSYAASANYWKSEQNPGDGKTFKPYATFPATAQGKGAFITGYSNYWMEDGSFTRIKNIRVAYSLPQGLLRRTSIRNARIYANAENVHVFSKYVGFDPQNSTYSVGTSSQPGANGGNSNTPPGLMLGADYGAYPIPFVMTFGLKLDF
ncbi:TonB-dependent receptor [Paraflavisolibacter sp. H34]|uniref:SusC/RagA family TonB-linked outer membrane protein n=1 Tax=Huijunlia imazamoxiresistens TaxID=3127457 RepID=UPI00301698E9